LERATAVTPAVRRVVPRRGRAAQQRAGADGRARLRDRPVQALQTGWHLPHETASVANLVLFDVFHHLGDPAAFLDEAARVLVPTGRVVIVDPYCSPVSTRVFTRFHHERTDLTAPPFEADTGTGASPLESNQARATLIFYRGRRHFQSRWPHLPIVHERRFAFFVYPLTGGFTGPTLLPRPIYRPLQLAEGLLQPLAPLLAFRCMIVLQRR
jgi:SAM-dependent methyltransferase